MRVHYTGYGSEDDEWRNKDDIVVVQPLMPGKYTIQLYVQVSITFIFSILHTLRPFHLHNLPD